MKGGGTLGICTPYVRLFTLDSLCVEHIMNIIDKLYLKYCLYRLNKYLLKGVIPMIQTVKIGSIIIKMATTPVNPENPNPKAEAEEITIGATEFHVEQSLDELKQNQATGMTLLERLPDLADQYVDAFIRNVCKIRAIEHPNEPAPEVTE